MESNHGSTTLFFATSKCCPRYLLCPGHLPQYRPHWRGGEMAASGYSKHDDWLFPIFRRAVTDLSLDLQTGARVGTTRWPPEPQNPTPRVASSSQYQLTLRSPVLLCRDWLCALGGGQSGVPGVISGKFTVRKRAPTSPSVAGHAYSPKKQDVVLSVTSYAERDVSVLGSKTCRATPMYKPS